MKRSLRLSMIMCVAIGLALAGCAAKKKTGGGPSAGGSEPTKAATSENVKWAYDTQPAPPFEGTPKELLTSFGFEHGSAILKSEAMGACQEAVAKLEGKPDARILSVGFADGIKEKDQGDRLGTERAEAAKRFLGTLGVAANRIHVASFGARYSTARDFETIKQGHERKVELWVLE